MKILAVGGGSGGHVTPVVAVIRDLIDKHPDAQIRFWCDFKFAHNAKSLVGSIDKKIEVTRIFSGKLRRYHHISLLRHLLWPKLILLNIRDLFSVLVGIIQSLFLLIVWRPDVIFAKGGYVCLPVGIAARILNIPLVIHDSDAHPGLTNRILSKWAKYIATGAPLDYYNYPKNKASYVGIPISSDFHPFNSEEQIEAKKKWGIAISKPLLVVTGGGLGAQRINNAVTDQLEHLLKDYSVVLLSGSGQYDELRSLTPANNREFQLYPFVSEDMASLLGAADLVVARAGATTILELAALAKPTILVPNAKLSGGHQLKNAKVYKDAEAVEILNDDALEQHPELIVEAVDKIFRDKKYMLEMSKNFSQFAKPNASKEVAELIIKATR